MNILHITDFHYNADTRIMSKIIPSMIACLKSSGKQIDFILFTGDLVFNGSNAKHFEEAKNALFQKLCTDLSVPAENVIFCPGNHDIDRNQIRYAHDTYIKTKISNNNDLNLLYNGKSEDKFILDDLLSPLTNYKDFLTSYHQEDGNNIYGKLYSIHYRIYKKQKIAYVCLYTPWLSNIDKSGGKNDSGNLLIPTAVFSEIENAIDTNANKRIILMHHPISFLRDFNAYEVENEIYDNYNMLFSGHVHKISNVARNNGNNGIYEHTAKASLSEKEILGCTFIENDDIEDNKFSIYEITYIKDSNECHFGSPLEVSIPIGAEKENLNKIRKKIYQKVDIERENANNLLLIKQDDGGQDFLNTYNSPLIRSSKENSSSQTLNPLISLDYIYSTENHLIILGKDKCGKTSLLRRVQLEYLMNFTNYNRIPLFLDAKQEEHIIDDKYDITTKLRNYLEVNTKDTEKLLLSDHLVLLVDNYRPGTAMSNFMEKFCSTHPQTLIIAAGEDAISSTYEIGNISFGETRRLELFYFNDLRRKEIIQYTDRQLATEAKKKQIQEKILKLCKQMELPYNYWTISLFLLIHHKASDAYSKNLYAILDICVDEIFNKKKILLEKWPITYPQLKNICAQLSTFLFKNHEGSVYSAPKRDIIKFLKEVISKNRRYAVSAEEIFNFFVSCGLLKLCTNDYYVFRLNGFFEYFLAYQMTQDEGFKTEILSDEKKYLAFKNQLEIYSGLKNTDSDFLKFVFVKTNSKVQPLFAGYNENKDIELIEKIKIPETIERESRMLSVNSLTSIQAADVEDLTEESSSLNSEVHLMVDIDPSENNIDVLGRYLSILSRVFKNVDQVNDKIIDPVVVFKKIISYYCDFSFFVIEELSKKTKSSLANADFINIEEEEAFRLLKMMSNFSPLIAQMEVYDGIGHFSMENMVRDEINELKKNSSNNQYKLFILYFFLFDLSLDNRNSLMDEVISLINMPLLRYMMNLKFNYYLAFKSDGNSTLQNVLSQKIRTVRLLIDNKTDSSSIDGSISGMKKDALINRQRTK